MVFLWLEEEEEEEHTTVAVLRDDARGRDSLARLLPMRAPRLPTALRHVNMFALFFRCCALDELAQSDEK